MKNTKINLRNFFWHIAKAIFFLLLIVILIGIWGYKQIDDYLFTTNDKTIQFEIPKGTTSSAVGKSLEKEGLLKDDIAFKLLIMKDSNISTFKAGKYNIEPYENLNEIINKFSKGETIKREIVKITIPEGLNLKEVSLKIEEYGFCSSEEFLLEADTLDIDKWFLKNLPTKNKLEGFLYPETYNVYKDSSAEELINVFLNQMEIVLNPYKDIIESSGYSPYQIITLSSLVEKEALHNEDRPLIGSVINNRLKSDMLLQIDASVIYGLGGGIQELTQIQLEEDTPYNLYIHKGLPPTPIAMPRKESIEAIIYPEDSEYFYYVADKNTGYHHFAKTYDEHLTNIKKYWKKE